jgi:hypothetical protein
MRSSDGKVPTMLLARLRLGAFIEELVNAIRVGQVLEGYMDEGPNPGFF